MEPHPLQLPARPGGSELRSRGVHHVLAGGVSILSLHHGTDGELIAGVVRGLEVQGGESLSLSLSIYLFSIISSCLSLFCLYRWASRLALTAPPVCAVLIVFQLLGSFRTLVLKVADGEGADDTAAIVIV